MLAKLKVDPSPTGLVDSSLTAVQALAKASGVTLSATTSVDTPSSRNHDRLVIVIAALATFYTARLAGYVCIAEIPDALLAPPPPIIPSPVAPAATIDRDELILSDVPLPASAI